MLSLVYLAIAAELMLTFESQALLRPACRLSHHVTMAPLVAFINSARLYMLQHYHHLHLAFINSAPQQASTTTRDYGRCWLTIVRAFNSRTCRSSQSRVFGMVGVFKVMFLAFHLIAKMFASIGAYP